jgi:hypothetical protein
MQIMVINFNNVIVINVNNGINANNVILISLQRCFIETCNRNTVVPTELFPLYCKTPTTYLGKMILTIQYKIWYESKTSSHSRPFLGLTVTVGFCSPNCSTMPLTSSI